MENNKLIAEFMGYKLMSCNRGKAWDIGKSIPSKDHLFPIQGVLHTGNELKFHTSWDWLMPVINKIRSMDSTYEVEEVGKYDWDNEISHYEFDLDLTYESVVEFIKQYNK